MQRQRRMIHCCSVVSTLFLVVVIACQASSTIALQSSQQGQQKTTEEQPVRINATLVQVPAVVTDRSGKFVTDLSRGDFSVSEDGKRQDISLFAAIKQPFSAVMVLDTSNSAQDRLKAI